MLSFPPTIRAFVCVEPVDMRKSFDGLCGCAEHIVKADPLSGHLFVFFNRRRHMVKILMWDRTGFCIYSKRLEAGRFHWCVGEPHGSVEVDFPRLLLILEGIDLSYSRQRKRYRLEQQNAQLKS